jgi:hypothetical protein
MSSPANAAGSSLPSWPEAPVTNTRIVKPQ